MRYLLAAFVLSALSIQSEPAFAQSAAGSARTNQLVARFTKQKHVVKESHGVRREKYKDMRGEPVILSRPAEYSGTYNGDFGFTLHLSVDANGRISGSGTEPLSGDTNAARSFTISNAKLDGALLTATKNYADGNHGKLEGVFINLISRDSPADPGLSTFGLGVITPPTKIDGLTIERLFYARSTDR